MRNPLPATAILGTPVVVVFFRIPVARPASDTPLIFVTVNEGLIDVVPEAEPETSPDAVHVID